MKRPADKRNKLETDLVFWRNSLGVRLREARQQSGLTTRALASLAGVSQSEISKIENNGQDCKLDSFIRIFSFLGIPPGHVIDDVVTSSFAYFGKRVQLDPQFNLLLKQHGLPVGLQSRPVSNLLGTLAATAVYLSRCSCPERRTLSWKYPNAELEKRYKLLAKEIVAFNPESRIELRYHFVGSPIASLFTWGLLNLPLIKDAASWRKDYIPWLPIIPGRELHSVIEQEKEAHK